MHTQALVPAHSLWQIPVFSAAHDERRVLVADDDLAATNALCLALDDEGFVARAVHTGLDVVTMVRKWSPGAVLLDLAMPLGDGWEAIDAIRGMDPSMLLLAHTGRTDHEDYARAQRCGFNGYFVKPIEFDCLVDVLRRYFSNEAAGE